jgi:hypothetical protein
MPTCKNCNNKFPNKIKHNGEFVSLSGRKFCLECSPIGGRNTRSYIVKLNENEAYCIHCQQIKSKDEFYTRKNSGKPLSYCMICQQEIKKIKLEENLELIVQSRGGACQDCNFSYPSSIYEFYSENGTYNLSKAKNMSFERLIKELETYDMVCRNCSGLRDWEKGI